MRQGPTPAGPGRDEDPAREPREPVHTPDPMTGEDWQAWCDSQADQDEPPDTAEEAAAYSRAARLGLAGGQSIGLGRRGPGQPGSARRAPGEYLSQAAGF